MASHHSSESPLALCKCQLVLNASEHLFNHTNYTVTFINRNQKGVFFSVEYNKYYSLKLLNATSALPHILSTKAEISMTRFFFLVHQTEISQKPIRNHETNSQQKLSYSQKPYYLLFQTQGTFLQFGII